MVLQDDTANARLRGRLLLCLLMDWSYVVYVFILHLIAIGFLSLIDSVFILKCYFELDQLFCSCIIFILVNILRRLCLSSCFLA